MTPSWLSYWSVNDVDKAFEKAKSLGAQANMPPTDIPGVGRSATLIDPTGAAFALFSAPKTP